MDMIARKKKIMMMLAQDSELYPIGTDICDYYGLKSTAIQKKTINTNGEIVDTTSTSIWSSADYAEINPNYTYAKKQYRLYRIAYYDANKTFIDYTDSMNETIEGMVLQDIPSNAKYVRISMYHTGSVSWNNVGLVRTA